MPVVSGGGISAASPVADSGQISGGRQCIHSGISILDEVEKRTAARLVFIEANSCLCGCIGGSLNVANRFPGRAPPERVFRAATHMADAHPEKNSTTPGSWPCPLWEGRIEPNPGAQLRRGHQQGVVKYEMMNSRQESARARLTARVARRLPGAGRGHRPRRSDRNGQQLQTQGTEPSKWPLRWSYVIRDEQATHAQCQ